jgi:hypothetical protein
MDALLRAQRARQSQGGKVSGGGAAPELPGLSASRLVGEAAGTQTTPGVLSRPSGYAGIPRPARFLPPSGQPQALYQLLSKILPGQPGAPGKPGAGVGPSTGVGGGGGGSPVPSSAGTTSDEVNFPTKPGPVLPGSGRTATTFPSEGAGMNMFAPGGETDATQQAIKEFLDALNAPAGSAI